MGLQPELGTGNASRLVDARRCPRYKLETEIRVYPREAQVVHGHTVDISESGISAMLVTEVPLDEVVQLEFKLPLGEVAILALVRQRQAFRYGFQFLEPTAAHEAIGRTCRQLAVEEATQQFLGHQGPNPA